MNKPLQQRLIAPPGGYPAAAAGWVWMIEDTRRRTKQSLDGLNDREVNWRPPQGGNSIGSLLYHLAAIEMSYIYEDILGSGWAPELDELLPYDVRDEAGLLTAVKDESLTAHLARLDATRALSLRALAGLSGEELRRRRVVGEYAITPEWALHHLMQHEAEHRGQIGEIRAQASCGGS